MLRFTRHMWLMDAVTIYGLSKTYETPQGPLAALDNVSLRVAPGEILALIGPSGCGKSTLLRLVGDLEPAGSGEIRVFGRDPQAARLARSYGIAFQAPALLDWRTTAANVALPLELAGVPPAERQARVATLLEQVGLAGFADTLPRKLSGGMQQRAAFARALALNPALLLLDEPFSALDELTRERLQTDLPALLADAELRPAVIFVTHSLNEAVFLADRIAVMSARPGCILREITIDLPARAAMGCAMRRVSTHLWPRCGRCCVSVCDKAEAFAAYSIPPASGSLCEYFAPTSCILCSVAVA